MAWATPWAMPWAMPWAIPDSLTARTDPLKRCQRSRKSSSRKPKCPTMPPRVSNATVEISTDQQNQKLDPKVTKKKTSSLDPWRTANNSTSDIQSILSIYVYQYPSPCASANPRRTATRLHTTRWRNINLCTWHLRIDGPATVSHTVSAEAEISWGIALHGKIRHEFCLHSGHVRICMVNLEFWWQGLAKD